MLIDFHCHFNLNDPEKIREFVQAYEERGVVGCIVGGLNYGEHDMVPNDEVIRICKEYPGRLYPLAKIDLGEQTPSLDEVRRYADLGVKGFKFIYPWYEYDHDLYMPVYEEIEKIGLPVLFHTGNYRPNATDRKIRRPMLKNMCPVTLDRIARSFQDLHIVMAHLGTMIWHRDAAELIKLHANLYADLAGNGGWMGVTSDMLEELLRPKCFPLQSPEKYYKKLVFGTDSYISTTWPMREGLVYYQKKLEMLGLSEETRDGIMGNTVGSWIGLVK